MTRVDVERWRRELRACRTDAEIDAWLTRHIEKSPPPDMRWLAKLILGGWGMAITVGLAVMLITDWQKAATVLGLTLGVPALVFGTVWAVNMMLDSPDDGTYP